MHFIFQAIIKRVLLVITSFFKRKPRKKTTSISKTEDHRRYNRENPAPVVETVDAEFVQLVEEHISIELSKSSGTDLITQEEGSESKELIPKIFSVFSRLYEPIEPDELEATPEPLQESENVGISLIAESVAPQVDFDEEQIVDYTFVKDIETHEIVVINLEPIPVEEPIPLFDKVDEEFVLAINSAPIDDLLPLEIAASDELRADDFADLEAVDDEFVSAIDSPVDDTPLYPWGLLETVRIQFDLDDQIDNSQELSRFLDQLRTGTLSRTATVNDIEPLLRTALRTVGLVGDLPISEVGFQQLCTILRGRYAVRGGRPSLRNARCPALFVTTMVFCARYAKYDARNFWTPYAQLVWQRTEIDQTIRNTCAEFFLKSRIYLEDRFHLPFVVINAGDVVRPIYRHAILPYYLQSDFADWLIKNIQVLAKISFEELPTVLQNNAQFAYLSKSLRQFILSEDTRETAYNLIQQMKRAIDLYTQETDADEIKTELNSLIERELWERVSQALAENVERGVIARQSRPKLEWVWSLESDMMALRLLNIRVKEAQGKPDVLLWTARSAPPRIGQGITEYLHPWISTTGWLIDEVIFAGGEINGHIYVLAENGDILYENDIPALPAKPFTLFRITQQRQYGIPIDYDTPITAGEWLISLARGVEIMDENGQVLTPCEKLEPPDVLKTVVQHQNAGQYALQPPIQFRQNGHVIGRFEKQESLVGQPYLEGGVPMQQISVSVQPVFLDRDIRLHIPHFEDKPHRITLSIRGGRFTLVRRLDDLLNTGIATWKDHELIVNLGALIPDENAVYLVNLRRDLQSIMLAPFQFSLLRGIEIQPVDPNRLYSPVSLPSITLAGVGINQLELPAGAEIKSTDKWITVTWTQLKDDECRLRLQLLGSSIPLAWRVNRVDAWIEGVNGKLVYGNKLSSVTIHARGEKRNHFRWVVQSGDVTEDRDISLDAHGRYDKTLRDDALHDLIKRIGGAATIYAEANGMRWEIFTYLGDSKAQPIQIEPLAEDLARGEAKAKLEAVRERMRELQPKPQRKDRAEIEISGEDKQLIADLIAAVQANNQINLQAQHYFRLATLPISRFGDATYNEVKAIWIVLAKLQEVHAQEQWHPRNNWAYAVIDRLFAETQLQAPHSRYTIHRENLTSIEGYCFAADDWIGKKNKRTDQSKLVATQPWRKHVRFLREALEVYTRFPMIAYSLELITAVSGESETKYHNPLLQLDSVILLMALMLRLQAYYPELAGRLKRSSELKDAELQAMLFVAIDACPALLQWAFIWVETFYTHAESL